MSTTKQGSSDYGAKDIQVLEGLDPGRCRAVVRAPGFAAWRRDGVEPDEAGADLGDLELETAKLSGELAVDGKRPTNRPRGALSC